MNQKSIRLLHNKIEFVLKWNWGIFLLAKLVFLLLFIVISFLHLQDASALWQTFFLNRLHQLEYLVDAETTPPSIPVVHELIIGADGMIRKAPTVTLQGMILNASGFFGKIHQLLPGQMAIVFFPDLVDGVQRVHFVKRYADCFAVHSFVPKEFFPFSLTGKTQLSISEGGIIWFSDDPQQIGNVYRYAPITIKTGRIYLSFADRIADMSEANLIITQDITAEITILLLTEGMLLLVFGSVSLRTRKIQKDFMILQHEQSDLMKLIQKLSALVLQPGANVSERLEQLAPALHQSFQEAGQAPLQFEENHQYQYLVREFIGDILLLVDVVKQEEDKLRESEEKYRRIFETMEDGYILSDLATSAILSVNPAAARMLCYDTPENLQGKNIVTEVYVDDQERDAMIAALQEPRVLHGYVLRFRRRDGAEILVDANLHLLGDHNNTPVAIEGTIRDITERKRIEEALRQHEARLASAIEVAHLGLYELTDGDHVSYIHDQLRTILGMTAEYTGRRAFEFWATHLHPDDRQRILGISQQLNEGGLDHATAEYRCLHPQHGAIWVRHLAHVFKRNATGQAIHLIGVFEDITERKQAEAELAQYRTHLEEVVAQRTAELTRANQQLEAEISERKRVEVELLAAKDTAEAASRAKSTFLAHMSHELRTPLNGILGYAQILRRQQELNAETQDGLQIIYQSGQHLLTLINDILDFSRGDVGRLTLTPADVHLSNFLDSMIGISRMRAQEKQVCFVVNLAAQLPTIIQTDEKRLRQVLLNLLSNAVKFTDSDGTVTFKVTDVTNMPHVEEFPSREGGGEGSQSSIVNLRFSIEDTGVGMTAEQVARLFQPFERAGDLVRQTDGTGLGLAISQQLVELMGGQIQVTSMPGQGSTFWFEAKFPASVKTTAAIFTPQGEAVSCADDKILPPPRADLEAVYTLAIVGRVFEIQEYAERLEAQDARYRPFARKIWNLAQAFEDAQIATLVQQYLEETA